jgi:hypothetical protein
MQAGFKADQVQVVGRFSDYTRVSDEADRKEHVFWVGLLIRLSPGSAGVRNGSPAVFVNSS